MSLKTPLRYPGGKSKSVEFLRDRFPSITEYREPFIGGGSVAIHVAKNFPSVPIWINDLYYPLFCFWTTLQKHSDRMIKEIHEIKDRMTNKEVSKEIFSQSQEILNTSEDPYLLGLHFYVANKCSFSGLGQTGSFSHKASISNFSKKGIDKLAGYSKIISGWKITNLDYSEWLDDSDAFVFLDPPYEIGKVYLYGKRGNTHRGFDHDDFAKKCNESSNKIMITYNSNSSIKDRFDGWNTEEWDLTYTMRSVGEYMENQKDRKELLLTNYGRGVLPI